MQHGPAASSGSNPKAPGSAGGYLLLWAPNLIAIWGVELRLRLVRAPHAFAAPTVSAMTAPRVPSGLSGPTVESRAV
jgi:hypothetical protein